MLKIKEGQIYEFNFRKTPYYFYKNFCIILNINEVTYTFTAINITITKKDYSIKSNYEIYGGIETLSLEYLDYKSLETSESILQKVSKKDLKEFYMKLIYFSLIKEINDSILIWEITQYKKGLYYLRKLNIW